MGKKLHIFYRHYNVTESDARRPAGFLYEKCFINLIETIKFNSNVVLNVIYDNKIEGDNWIYKYKYEVNFIEFQGGSDWTSFEKVGEVIDKYDFGKDDLIYLLENDYLHVNGWVEKIFELFNTYKLNYVSLYDHRDKYFLHQYDDLASKIIITDSHHWRTTPSTCASFIMDYNLYLQDKDIIFTMPGDHNKFIWLSDNRSRFVISPIPGLSTHCMEGLLSPTINWSKI
tara:strand:+ start:3264 stop:3947 length:684 start_codon:yes stop_codon:yes gene_type:complete